MSKAKSEETLSSKFSTVMGNVWDFISEYEHSFKKMKTETALYDHICTRSAQVGQLVA